MTTECELSPRSLADQDRHAPGTTCPANAQFTDEELRILDSGSRAPFAQRPFDEPGDECHGYDNGRQHHYGRFSMIQAIQNICEKWAKNHPTAPRIGVGDISLPDGGDTPRQASHEEGVDVDFSLVTNNGKEESSNWQNGNYSRELTQAFIDLIANHPVLAPRVILFNDPQAHGVQYHAGHDDHIHVRFQMGPNVKVPDFTPDTGDLKLVAPDIKSDRVKALQADWGKRGLGIEADGIFGKTTETAVKAFQRKYRLTLDSVARTQVLAKLTEVAAG